MTKKMKKSDALALAELMRAPVRYLDHPDVQEILGPGRCTAAASDLQQIGDYLRDVGEGERASRRDLRLVALSLQQVSDLLYHPRVAAISFALPSTAVARRLREAVADLKKYM